MEPSKSQRYFSRGSDRGGGKYWNGEPSGGDGEKEGKGENGKNRESVKDVPLAKTEIGGGGDTVMLDDQIYKDLSLWGIISESTGEYIVALRIRRRRIESTACSKVADLF